ncbi:MAG: hypothetical protein MPL62_11985 [Alphaproteobacteria bacterium]|nr:hypothetical protein [Alphaproteobacteria bacterium]
MTKTFTMLAQASDASRWVRASPQKNKLKKLINYRDNEAPPLALVGV